MLNILTRFDIYPDAIQNAVRICEEALQNVGYSNRDISDMEDRAMEILNECTGLYDITNRIITVYFEETKNLLEDKDLEVSYYVNCDDSHFYVEGEQCYAGDDTIERMLYTHSYAKYRAYQDVISDWIEYKRTIDPITVTDTEALYENDTTLDITLDPSLADYVIENGFSDGEQVISYDEWKADGMPEFQQILVKTRKE